MFTEIRAALRPAMTLLLLLAAITGLAYPALVTGVAQVALPRQANGSLIVDHDVVVGSELIAQSFAASRYFHPRPSAAGKGYDASNSAASNLAPGSKDLRDAIAARVAAARAEGMTGGLTIPPDLVTTSASGLDPDLSPEAAFWQVSRVAKARGLPRAKVRALVEQSIAWPWLGIIGDAHVNVLLLNRQLDRISTNSPT
ncbi:potassium-transporting ATPase subunit KdpC [Sphingomonas sp. MMS24-J45]|uniref:potassium-transporting ATPase subunit KdpC n=1 Tax=Sphingomonas sp. MMS24-J45 TaxID=3238806 RepID=UPI00384BB6F5